MLSYYEKMSMYAYMAHQRLYTEMMHESVGSIASIYNGHSVNSIYRSPYMAKAMCANQ